MINLCTPSFLKTDKEVRSTLYVAYHARRTFSSETLRTIVMIRFPHTGFALSAIFFLQYFLYNIFFSMFLYNLKIFIERKLYVLFVNMIFFFMYIDVIYLARHRKVIVFSHMGTLRYREQAPLYGHYGMDEL